MVNNNEERKVLGTSMFLNSQLDVLECRNLNQCPKVLSPFPDLLFLWLAVLGSCS